MKIILINLGILLSIVFTLTQSAVAQESLSEVRMPMDTVGYATTPLQMEAIINMCDSLENKRYLANKQAYPIMSKRNLIAAICPHDDYLYAGPVYFNVM